MDAKPLADEFIRGHIGRMFILSPYKTGAAFVAAMREAYASEKIGSAKEPLAVIAAGLSGVPTADYLRLHTMLPFTAFACTEKHRTPNGSWPSAVVRRSGALSPRKSAYLCPACVAEDRAFRGISYWRRHHQLPASFWCAKHEGAQLLRVPNRDAFDHPPEHWLAQEDLRPIEISPSARSNLALQRFQMACDAMLDGGISMPVVRVRNALREAARAAGLQTSHRHVGKRLSDVVREHLPEEVLQALLPAMTAKAFGAFHSIVDDAIRGGSAAPMSIGRALAMALLFPSVEEAYRAFARAPACPQSPSDRERSPSKIAELFFRHDGDLDAIAKALGLSGQEAPALISRARRSILNANPQARAAMISFEQGRTLADASGSHGVPPSLLEALMRLRLNPLRLSNRACIQDHEAITPSAGRRQLT